jgi:hypothetical protein
LKDASKTLSNEIRTLLVDLVKTRIDLLLYVFYVRLLVVRFEQDVGQELLVLFLEPTKTQAQFQHFLGRAFLQFSFEFSNRG